MDLYQHFRPEEHAFVDQVLDYKEQVEHQYKTVLTDFLDPREQVIFQTIIGKQSDLNLSFFGGYSEAERKRVILAPFYEKIEVQDYSLAILEGNYPSKFVNLSHRDILGTLMSLGIHRKKIGDIIVDDGVFQIIIDQDIEMFLKLHLTKIKKSSIELKNIPSERIITKHIQWLEKEGTVSSLRLDVIIKEIYQLSRQKTQQLIEKELVKVNHRTVNNPSYPVEEGDLISVRKLGRSKVIELLGKTKKDKFRVRLAKLK
ncbi:RNA-binding protein [Bacillaceae bacterium W0354]